MNPTPKSILTSKTFYGAALGFVAMFFPTLLPHIFGVSDPNLIAAHVVAIVAFCLTIYGRIKAKQPLNLLGSSSSSESGRSTVPCMGLIAVLGVAMLFGAGCNAAQAAQKFSNVFAGILSVAQADEPALPPSDAAIVNHWVTLGQTLDAQLNTCITATGGNKAKISACITAFGSGLTNQAELAQLRILSPGTQTKIQVIATAVILAVNAALTQFGGTAQPMPTVAPTPATTAELHYLSARLEAAGYALQ